MDVSCVKKMQLNVQSKLTFGRTRLAKQEKDVSSTGIKYVNFWTFKSDFLQ